MATDTEVANRTLLALGLDRIDDLATNGTYRANRINELFPTTRTSVLEEFPWNFSGSRAQLVRAAPTPVSGWAYLYTLPNDFLITRQARASADDFDVSSPRADKSCADIAFELREPQLLSDSEEVWLYYTRNLTDLANWPQYAINVFAYRLAMDLAVPFTESLSKQREMERLHDKAVVRARGRDTGNTARPRPRETGWITARFAGSGYRY
ncbi:MAG: hypothetical protein ACR2QF_04855 [Geminicoccaceae bacterium]